MAVARVQSFVCLLLAANEVAKSIQNSRQNECKHSRTRFNLSAKCQEDCSNLHDTKHIWIQIPNCEAAVLRAWSGIQIARPRIRRSLPHTHTHTPHRSQASRCPFSFVTTALIQQEHFKSANNSAGHQH